MSEDAAVSPRRIVRRGRTGFSFSRSSLHDSTTAEGAEGGDDDDDLNESIEARASQLPARIQAPPEEGEHIAGNPNEEFNPRARMTQVRNRASEYEREYRLGLLHRLLMRRVPIDEIADQLGLSISQVYRDRDTLKEKLRQDARTLDIEEVIGDSKGFYEEVAAIALRAASNSNAPLPVRLAAARTGLAAKNDMHRFFQTAGVYDVLRFRLGDEGKGVSDIRRLMDQTERVLGGQDGFSAPTDTGDDEEIEL